MCLVLSSTITQATTADQQVLTAYEPREIACQVFRGVRHVAESARPLNGP